MILLIIIMCTYVRSYIANCLKFSRIIVGASKTTSSTKILVLESFVSQTAVLADDYSLTHKNTFTKPELESAGGQNSACIVRKLWEHTVTNP